MKTFLALALVVATFAPAASAQTSPSFTGKWEGTFTMQRPDGTENVQPVTFDLMLAVAMLASYVPALRASRVDPVVALRAE